MSDTSSAQQSFLQDGESGAAAPRGAALSGPPGVGLLVTNHLNLMYMLAAGLLMPPAGFGGKHYRDSLAAYPGWLPLFIGHGRRSARAPFAAIEEATSEAKHLRPVLVEVDLAGLSGPVLVHGEHGWDSRRFKEGAAPDEWLLCVPAPLPTARARSILFRSADDRRETAAAAAERNNVPLADFTCKTARRRFSGSKNPWPAEDGPAKRDVALGPAQAAGGMMAVLHQLANAGELSVRACRAAFDSSSEAPDDSILGALPEWMWSGTSAERGGPFRTGRELFWGVVDGLVEHRCKRDRLVAVEARQQAAGRRAEDVLIDLLRESAEGMGGDLHGRAAELVATLESLGGGLGGGTVSEMLDQHRTPLARAAILFLLRQKTRELLELVEDYPQFEERDRLAAAILFGVRDGWLKLPVALRGSPEFGHVVTHRMAVLAHRLDESGFDLGEAPPRVRPLRELFGGSEAWDAKREKAAVRLARSMKWDCIRTTVSLGRGSYRFRIEGGSAHIDFEGEPRFVTRVDRDRFFESMAGERIDSRLERAVRGHLGV